MMPAVEPVLYEGNEEPYIDLEQRPRRRGAARQHHRRSLRLHRRAPDAQVRAVRRRARHLRDRHAQGRRRARGRDRRRARRHARRRRARAHPRARRSCGTTARPTGDRRSARRDRARAAFDLDDARAVRVGGAGHAELTRARVPARGAARASLLAIARVYGGAGRARRRARSTSSCSAARRCCSSCSSSTTASRTYVSLGPIAGRGARASASTTARTRPRSIAARCSRSRAARPRRRKALGMRPRQIAAPRAAAAGAAARAAADDERLRVAAQGLARWSA